MKVSNNALNFLLAQYRAIFKRAYVKGLASAVMLTAALAAGQAQADSTLTGTSGGSTGSETVAFPAEGQIANINGGSDATYTNNSGNFTKIQVATSGDLTWGGTVNITSGAKADNYIKSSATDGTALNITGETGVLNIDVAGANNGLTIAGSGTTSAAAVTVQIGEVNLKQGYLDLDDGTASASGSVTLSAGQINIGTAEAQTEDTPSTAAAPERKAFLTVSADQSGLSGTLGGADSVIKVEHDGQITLSGGAGATATVKGTSLTVNEGGLLLINGAGTNEIAVDLDIESGAFGVVAGSAIGSFTGEKATVAGNLLVNGTLNVNTANNGTVTLADGSNTVISKTVTVNSGTLVVESGAALHAAAGSSDAKIEVKSNGAADTNVTLKIDSSALESFLNSGDKYTAINEDGSLGAKNGASGAQGQINFSGGDTNKLAVLELTDITEVDLSDFKFAKSAGAAGKIYAQSHTLIKGNNIRIAEQLGDGSDVVEGGASGKISIEATSLTLGDNNAAATDYGFKSAKVANLYNDANGEIALGNAVTLDATVGADTIEPDANGKFSGDFVLDDSAGKLTVAHGTYTHSGSLTIEGTGKLDVTNTADSTVNTKLTLTELNLQAGTGTAITVDGKDNDAASTILDISSAEFTVSGGSTSGTITVQSGGTLVANGKQVQDILNADGAKGFAVKLDNGNLEVTEGLELNVAKLNTTSADEDQIQLVTTHGNNTILVNGELALTNISSALNYDKTEFTAEELTLKMDSGQKGPAQLQSGTYTAWSGLDGNNGIEVSGAYLHLGGFDEVSDGVYAAKSNGGNIGTTLAIKGGSATIQNGKWTGSTITVSDAGTLKVGYDDSTYVDANGDTFTADLSVTSLTQSAGTTTIAKKGSVTTDSLEVADGIFTVNGAMTVNGAYKEAVLDDSGAVTTQASYGVKLTAGKITLGENASLSFGADATKAIKVNATETSGSGWISIASGSFGTGTNPANGEKVIGVNVGSTVTFNFDSGTSFGDAALKEFRKEIFGQETPLDGYINLGSAKIDGLTVDNGEVKWSNLQNFIDTNSDYTTELLQEAKVTEITSDAELRGSLGSLSSKTLAAGDQIKVDGNLALNNAAGNGGAFASNTTGDVLGLNVTGNAQVNLNNGGEIGTVTFSSKGGSFVVESDNTPTTIAAIEGAHASTHFTTGTATVKGETKTKQLTTDAGTNTTFEGAVTVGQQAADTDVSTLAGDTIFKGAATFAQGVVVANTANATFARDVEFENGASLYGNTKVDGTATFAADAKGVALTVDQGAVVAINKLVTDGNVFVGSVSTSAGHEGATGTLSVETLQLKGHDLVVDPDWNNEAGLAFVGVNQFYDGTPVDDDAGILNGKAYALQNSILSIGNKNKDEVLAIFDKYINAQGNLSNDKDGVGAIVYVADTVKVAAGHKIVADKTLNQNTYTNATYSADGAFIGKNSVLGVEVSAANGFKDDGVTPQAAITFTNAATVYSDKTGKILLTGDYDQSDRITLFDSENGQVKVSGDAITVETINGLLTFNYDGKKKSFNISEMTVDTKRAQSAFSATSSPVHDALVAYGTGNTDWRNAATNTDDENAMAKTHGAAVSGIVFFDGKFYYESKVENKDPTDEVKDPEITKLLTTVKVENPDYDPQNPGSVPQYLDKVVYKADNPLLSAINNQQANSGISAESAARMADFAGVAQVALKAGNSTSDAISGRMGMGAQNSAITYANNGQGAGLWVTPIYMNSDSDGFEAQGISYGTDINLYGVALGGDYTLANGIRVGAMFNVGSGDVDGQGAGSNVSSDFDYYGFGLYAGYTMGQFSIVGDVSYTAVDNDVEANTEFADIGKLETSLDSSNISFGVTGAYAFDTAAGVQVTPHVGLRYSYIDIDDYTVGSKKGAIGSYSADSLSVFSIPVGVTIASEFNAGSWSVKPSFDVTLTGNFGDDENEGTFHWDGVENIDSGLTSEIFDNFTYGATLGVAAQSASGISLGLSVGYTGSSNVDDFGVNANARFTF